MRKSIGAGNQGADFQEFINKRVCLLSVGLLSMSLISCAKKEVPAPSESGIKSSPEMKVSFPSEVGTKPAVDTVSMIDDFSRSDEEGLRLAFSGMKTEGGDPRFKVYDWELEQEAWVSKGEDYRGYKVVGLDPSGKDVLVLEKDAYWFVYPLEHLQLDNGKRGEKPKILMFADIPEGVSIMDYIAENTEPLNPSEMPVDLNPGPVEDMDALIEAQTPVNPKSDEM